MADFIEQNEAMTVQQWLEQLAIPMESPLYELVLEDCAGTLTMLGRQAVNSITTRLAEPPSKFMPMSDAGPDMRPYIRQDQSHGANHVCICENGNIPSDEIIVKHVGDQSGGFMHYRRNNKLGGLYLPLDAGIGYRGGDIPIPRHQYPYSILFAGRRALDALSIKSK